MQNQRKLPSRIWAVILAIILVVGLMPTSIFAENPSEVTSDLNGKTVYINEEVKFTVTTTANDDATTPVLGYFAFSDWSAVESLEYWGVMEQAWLPLPQDTAFGPAATGFPMSDATSQFRVTLNKEGDYTFSVSMKKFEDSEELCRLDGSFSAVIHPSEVTTDIAEKAFVVGTAEEFTFTSIPYGHKDQMVFGKFTFSDWDAVSELKYWGVTENMWLTLPKDTLFGPAGTGFPMTNATSRFQVVFNKSGEYTCKVALVLASDTSVELSSVEKTITVTETIPPVVESVTGNPENWSQSATVTATVSDEGGSGIAKVLYSKESEYKDTHNMATKNEDGTYGFTVTENATYYIWAVDGNGNKSEAKPIVIDKIDTEAPELNVSASTEDWTNGDVTINVEVQEPNGVTVKYNTVDDLESATELTLTDNKGTITVSSQYNGQYYVWAIDTADNAVKSNITVKIDKTAPTVNIITVPSETPTNGDVVINGTAADDDSKLDKIVYSTGIEPEKAEGAAELKNDGSYSFTVTQNGTYNVWAKDNAGNYSIVATIAIGNIDKTAPGVDTIVANPNVATNQNVIISGTVSDTGTAGIEKVVFNTTGNYEDGMGTATLDDAGNYTIPVQNIADFDGKYYVWVIDEAGNKSERKEVVVKIDITAPVVDFAKADPDVATNQDVTISGKVSDAKSEIYNSGIEKVVFNTTGNYADGVQNATVDADGNYTITVSKNVEFNGKYYIWAVDKAGNVSENPVAVDVKIDTTAPVVDTIVANPNAATNENVTISGTVSDAKSEILNSGINKVVYNSTGEYGVGMGTATLDAEGKYTFTITEDFKGKYYVWTVDNAGNVSEAKSVDVLIDRTAPTGTITVQKENANTKEYEDWFSNSGSKENNATFVGRDFTKFHSNTTVKVSVSAVDTGISSDVKGIWYYKSNQILDADKLPTDPAAWTSYTDAREFSGNERFVLYFRVEDNAGNVTFLSTDGIIVDDKEPSGAEKEEIDIVIKPEDTNKTESGIYKGDVTVDITVFDPLFGANGDFSGLKEITYLVNTKDTDAKAEATLYGNVNLGQIVKDETTGLTAKWTGKVTIPAETFNSNHVYITVTAVDNAGNKRVTEYGPIAIDVTAPKINISFDNNEVDSGSYFKDNRTATITVTERNFNIEDLKLLITASEDGKIPTIVWGEPTFGDGNMDNTVYTGTVLFDTDGDYTFYAECKDKAGWTCGNDETSNNQVTYVDSREGVTTVTPNAFTIDKTDPVVTVKYDNNSAANGKYFLAYRIATVTIVEHNFPMDENGVVDIERVKFDITIARGETEPTITWQHDGDTHIATIAYKADGDYTFALSVTDLAGRVCADEAADYTNSIAPKDFVVDTDKSMITQSGVDNGVAYGYDATVIPSIKISDINLEDYTVTLTGIQKDATIDLTDKVNELLKGDYAGTQYVEGVFDIFAKEQGLDGIYTLKLTSKDLAGNEDSLEIVFTVNRFGSVYVYDQYLSNLIANGGSYVYSVDGDLIITEYNADKLLAGSLKIEITLDGKPLENVKYSVTPEINDSVTTGSSGWYQYRYTISKDNFAADGVYKISVSSEDATGNKPENSNYEGMDMAFRVDTTKADISSIVGLEKAIINAQNVTVKYTVFDTIGIKNIKVYVNGVVVSEITDFSADMNNYSGSFEMTENSSAQTVKIVVEDMAGNVITTDDADFSPAYDFNGSVTVSTNIFVRWYANKGLFWGSIAGVVVLAAIVIFLISRKGKGKKEIAE